MLDVLMWVTLGSLSAKNPVILARAVFWICITLYWKIPVIQAPNIRSGMPESMMSASIL